MVPTVPGSIRTTRDPFYKFFKTTTFSQYLFRILENLLFNFKFWTKNGPFP